MRHTKHGPSVMHLCCPYCERTLEFTDEPPLFCGYCGKGLRQSAEAITEPDESTRVFRQGAAQARPAPPSSIGGYRILRRLGGGGMGDVYEAEETSSGQHVALKVIAPQFAGSETAVERFRQEGRLASLISHPRCVFVLAADEQDGLPYIVMELISGKTLQAYVAESGPLPVEEAVTKILDVMEGLTEAHRLGVVHRDVKPSNCFMLEDGRVKIGDFGLSKSLVSSADLTKTGTFLGTFLYASPEQIKGERVDFRSDIYSVSATLYFLLAGAAPFQGKDAAATLARTMSETPTPLRRLRPDVPAALDRVIRRGLERAPERRWRSLDDLHWALRRFVPGKLSMAAMGLRAGAMVIDFLLFSTVSWLLLRLMGVSLLADETLSTTVPGVDDATLWTTVVGDMVLIAYFALFEGFLGSTPGKWLLHLRIANAQNSEPPGPLRALGRTMLFYLFTNVTLDITTLFPGSKPDLTAILGVLSVPIGVLLMISSMRARNGYRGWHELWSGTRVVRWPRRTKPEMLESRRPTQLLDSETSDLDRQAPGLWAIGPFSVRRELPAVDGERLLLAEDLVLGRKVLLRGRAATAAPLAAARRNLHRPTRLRWLSTAQQDGICWDAFLAPAGCPLADLCDPARPLSWRAFRGILEQLTDELALAAADGTLPARLSVEQIWVQRDGRVQLLDIPLHTVPAQSHRPYSALDLVRAATRLALEGAAPKEDLGPIRTPVPEHAARMLERLVGGRNAYQSVIELREDLDATRDQLPEVNRALRIVQLVVLAMAVGLPVLLMFGGTVAVVSSERLQALPAFTRQTPPSTEQVRAVVLWMGLLGLFFFPAVWVLWSFLSRGGLTLRMMGLTLVRRDGRRAGRWRCACRAALVWLPLATLLFVALALKIADDRATLPALGVGALALVYVLACFTLALWRPTRSFHDRLAGTFLVPR